MSYTPILYSFRRCPYAMRARLALAVSKIEVELREVVLRDKPQEMLRISPKGTVPVLRLESELIDESLDIMLWALKQGDPQSWLLDESMEESLALIGRVEEEFKPNLDRYKYETRYPGAVSEEHRELAAGFLWELEERLQRREFLFSDHPSLADAAIAPFVRQFANTDREWFAAQGWSHLIAWLQSFVDSELFQAVMKKYQQWKEGDSPTFFRVPEGLDTWSAAPR